MFELLIVLFVLFNVAYIFTIILMTILALKEKDYELVRMINISPLYDLYCYLTIQEQLPTYNERLEYFRKRNGYSRKYCHVGETLVHIICYTSMFQWFISLYYVGYLIFKNICKRYSK